MKNDDFPTLTLRTSSPSSSATTTPSTSTTVASISGGGEPKLSSLQTEKLNESSIEADQNDSKEVEERDDDGVLVENGIEIVRLSSKSDPLSPINLSPLKKWIIVITISTAAFCVTCASSMVPFTYRGMEKEFMISQEIATLGLSLFVIGLGWAPLVLSPLSEFYGRRPIYNIGFALFVIFNFMVAFAPNIGVFLAGRLLTGAAGSAFLSVAGGTIADIYAPAEIGLPLSFYTVSPFLGPAAGPIISGFINSNLDWRWTWYVVIIWAFVELVMLQLLVPETFVPALLMKKAKRLRAEGRTEVKAPLELDERSIPKVIITSCGRPFEILVLEPIVLLLCLSTSILLAVVYMFFSAFSIIYEAYGFTVEQIGLTFLAQAIGVLLGTASHPIWQYYYKKSAEATGSRPAPEEHLRRGIIGAIIVPLSLFVFAFTTYTSVPWEVSVFATIPFGYGTILMFSSVFTYLVDGFRPVAASAMAANSCTRASFAAGFPLFTAAMFSRLGNQGAIALCAGIMSFFPFAFYYFFKHGARLRKNSKFANQE